LFEDKGSVSAKVPHKDSRMINKTPGVATKREETRNRLIGSYRYSTSRNLDKLGIETQIMSKQSG